MFGHRKSTILVPLVFVVPFLHHQKNVIIYCSPLTAFQQQVPVVALRCSPDLRDLPVKAKFWATQIFWAAKEIWAKPVLKEVSMFLDRYFLFNPEVGVVKPVKFTRDSGCPGRDEFLVSNVVHILAVIPATSCSAERSFSAFRRLRTYLRNTKGQQRVSNVHRTY